MKKQKLETGTIEKKSIADIDEETQKNQILNDMIDQNEEISKQDNDDDEIFVDLQGICSHELSELEELGHSKSNSFRDGRKKINDKIGMENLFDIEEYRLFVNLKEKREVYKNPFNETIRTSEDFTWNVDEMIEKHFNT